MVIMPNSNCLACYMYSTNKKNFDLVERDSLTLAVILIISRKIVYGLVWEHRLSSVKTIEKEYLQNIMYQRSADS